jgi:hypothetical protein
MKDVVIGICHESVTNGPLKQIDSPASQAAENKKQSIVVVSVKRNVKSEIRNSITGVTVSMPI